MSGPAPVTHQPPKEVGERSGPTWAAWVPRRWYQQAVPPPRHPIDLQCLPEVVSTSVPHSNRAPGPDPPTPPGVFQSRTPCGRNGPKADPAVNTPEFRITSVSSLLVWGKGWRAEPSNPGRSLRHPWWSDGSPRAPFPLPFHFWPRQCKSFPMLWCKARGPHRSGRLSW